MKQCDDTIDDDTDVCVSNIVAYAGRVALHKEYGMPFNDQYVFISYFFRSSGSID